MPLVILTDHLIDLLKTLGETTGEDQDNGGVFLFTARGAFGEDPGETNLLAGLSTNGSMYSHYYLPFEGGELEPTFWPMDAIKALIGTFAPRAKEAEEHVLRITQLAGGQAEIAEYEDPSAGLRLIINPLPVENFPLEGAKRLLNGQVASTDRVAQNEAPIDDRGIELWDFASLGKALTIAKRRKTTLVVEKTVTNAVCMVRMAKVENWRGAILPPTPGEAILLNEGVEAVEVHLDVTVEVDEPETEDTTV